MHDALKSTDFSQTGLNLHGFPVECCHYGCCLLGAYLYRHGFTGIRKFSGSRSDLQHGEHLWLEVDGAVVDITAYQFADVSDEVIVTEHSAWHASRNGRPATFGMDGEPVGEYFDRIRSQFNDRFDGLLDRLESKADTLLAESCPQT
jgi:hypothetical protein